MSAPWDVAIIGGGIVGTATGMALARDGRARRSSCSRPRRRSRRTRRATTAASSTPGLYYKPGSLKARNCVEGREAMYRFCQEHGIPHERCGKLVVATTRDQTAARSRSWSAAGAPTASRGSDAWRPAS